MTDEVVIRLYGALVDALRRRDHPADEPVRVAELYEDLIPYRAVRSTLGVELNADYEHALLRLLAGAGDLVRIEPDEARQELSREADQPYPAVGLFRKFSASRAWVTLPPADPEDHARARIANDAVADPVPEQAAEEALPGPRPFTEPEPGSQPESEPEPGSQAAPDPEADAGERERSTLRLHTEPAPGEPTAPSGEACPFCGEELPSGRRVRFCPSCGGDQGLVPCPRCSAVLERDWEYCISCGHEVRSR